MHFCMASSSHFGLSMDREAGVELHPGLWMSAVATADLPQSAGSDVGGEDQPWIKICAGSKLAAPRAGLKAAISTAKSQELG